MNLLIVNDDGIGCKNPFLLKEVLKDFGRVFICVPDGERSGNSHSTYKYRILEENFKKSDKGDDVYIHNCTAADSVKFFLKFVTKDIDFVVSGVNTGFNLGVDVAYSGTVGAALEASMNGIKSIVLSARNNATNYWSELPALFKYLIYRYDWKDTACLSVNFPDGNAPFEYRFAEVAQVKQPSSGDNDYNLCRNLGYATISPLTANHTDYAVLKRLAGIDISV